ncbi:MAG: DUF222 domain-containing protein [Geodermatophilaceae bacterium]|nr:DUF222 domain-containing protein [Geodermatophilaceae bacterium]
MFESMATAEDVFGVSAGLPPVGGDVGSVLASLAEMPGSPGAMALLAGTDPAHLTLEQRVDLIRAWERQIAWASACQLPAVAALEDPGADEGPDPQPEQVCVPDWCREELAAALSLSGFQAQARLDLARDLAGRLPGTAAALRAGNVTAGKAAIIAKAVRVLSDEHAAAVEAAVLPEAARQTPGELHRALARAVLEADPEGAAERAADAVERRRVTGVLPLSDGMAGIWAELAAADAQTVIAGLDTDAAKIKAALRAAGTPIQDIPALATRRADALLGWAHRAQAEPHLVTTHSRRPTVHVTVSLSMLLGLNDAPGDLAGYGPIDAGTTRRIAAEGTWRRLLTDPASGALRDYGRTTYQPPADLREFILARDPVCAFTGCQRPARQCQLDHITEWQHGGTTTDSNLHPLCLRHHICKTNGGWSVTHADDRTTWTSPTGKTYTLDPTRIAADPPPHPAARAGPINTPQTKPKPPTQLDEPPPF